MNKNTIRLYQGKDCWVADNSKTDQAPELYRLFGTSHIPTPFTLNADEEMVKSEIERLNPGVTVLVVL